MQRESKRLTRFSEAFHAVTEHPSPCLAVSSFTGSSAAFAAAALATGKSGKERLPLVLAVTPGLPEADTLAANLHVLEKDCTIRILEFPPALEALVPPEKRAALRGVLANDPRPRYQRDPERVYGLQFAGQNVKFTVAGDRLTVKEVES